MNSEEITLCSSSVDQGGPSTFGVCIFISALVFPYIFLLNSEEITLFYDSVDWGGSICLWVTMTPMNSEEIILCSSSVDGGGPSAFGVCIFIYALVFPYIFLLVDCFKWPLIGDIENCTVHSVLWQFRGGAIYLWYLHVFYALVFPYIFLLVDCFEWVLIDSM